MTNPRMLGMVDLCYLLANVMKDDKTSFVFTLNQDMLLERLFGYGHVEPVSRPGVVKPIREFVTPGDGLGRQAQGHPGEIVTVQGLTAIPAQGWPDVSGHPNYIKLHGSWDWRADDGSEAMILGGGKEDAIHRRPLLDFYYEVFKSYLFSGTKRLLVIGYGFQDMHINKVLAEAIRNHGLRVFIWDIAPPRTMYHTLQNATEGETIWQSLCGYIQRPLRVVCPPNNRELQGLSDSARGAILKIFGDQAVTDEVSRG